MTSSKTGRREPTRPETGSRDLLFLFVGQRTRLGAEEGRKNRPCAIVAAQQMFEGRTIVTVVPVTHTPPSSAAAAIEIPAALKAHLGLDGTASWIVLTETNDFIWPGADLRPVPGSKPVRFDFWMLPPRFFTHVRDRILQARIARRVPHILRTE